MLQEQLQMSQLPNCGNLLTSKKKDVKMRIRCITSLLQFKEKNFAIKDQFQDKIRRLEMDKEIQEKKVAKLQKEILDLDREKYKVELKAKETVD